MKKISAKRDILDLLAIGIAILALISSVIIPLSFRACDKRASRPEVTVTAHYLRHLTGKKTFELRKRMASGFNWWDEGESAFPFLDFRIYRLEIVNHRNHPVSLRRIRMEPDYGELPEGIKPWCIGSVRLKNDSKEFEVYPVLNIEANGILKTEIAVIQQLFILKTFKDRDAIFSREKTRKFMEKFTLKRGRMEMLDHLGNKVYSNSIGHSSFVL